MCFQYYGTMQYAYCLIISMKASVKEIEKMLPEGKSLQACIQEKRVYMIDLSYIGSIDSADTLPSPICLFHVEETGDLMPIAIQLTPDPLAPVSFVSVFISQTSPISNHLVYYITYFIKRMCFNSSSTISYKPWQTFTHSSEL